MNKEKNRKIHMISIVMLLVIVICQGLYISANRKDTRGYLQSDYEYKIFWGKWEITEFMGYGRYCDGERQEQYLGNTIYYDKEVILINDEIVLKKPVYQFGIIPTDKYSIYTQIYPAQGGDILWENNKRFFVHVQLKQTLTENKQFFEFGDRLYIVDEDTLILDTDDGWYKMKRLEYIDGYPEIIQSI